MQQTNNILFTVLIAKVTSTECRNVCVLHIISVAHYLYMNMAEINNGVLYLVVLDKFCNFNHFTILNFISLVHLLIKAAYTN